MSLKLGLCVLICYSFIGCSTKTLHPTRISEKTQNPQVEEYKDGWLLWFINHSPPSAQVTCAPEVPLAIRTYISTEDLLIGLFTLGVYTPKTTQYWCAKKTSQSEAL